MVLAVPFTMLTLRVAMSMATALLWELPLE
jgi:hypothetical protein